MKPAECRTNWCQCSVLKINHRKNASRPPQECAQTNTHRRWQRQIHKKDNSGDRYIYSHKGFPRQDLLTKANSNDIDYDICYENDDICDDKHASKLQISKQKVIGSQCSELPHKIKLHLHKNYKRWNHSSWTLSKAFSQSSMQTILYWIVFNCLHCTALSTLHLSHYKTLWEQHVYLTVYYFNSVYCTEQLQCSALHLAAQI